MTSRNPIDQRHANARDIGCPVFWRRVGGLFALFLAVYPWVTAAAILAQITVRTYLRNRMPFCLPLSPTINNLLSSNTALVYKVVDAASSMLIITGMFLFLVGPVLCVKILTAWQNGFVNGWLLLICAVLASVGTAFLGLVILGQQAG